MDYRLDKGEFIIKNYDLKKNFCSFLPGIADLGGTPFWCFYVNRGQGIAGFGSRDKSCPIMEFSPAVLAYSRVNQVGFRTFIKANGSYFEPFAVVPNRKEITREMRIEASGFSVSEQTSYGLEVTASYVGMPNAPFSALLRKTTIKNTSNQPITIEVADGLSEMLPYGITNSQYKECGNILKSWMSVQTVSGLSVYKMRSSSADSSEVKKTEGGHFFASHASVPHTRVADPKAIFGHDNSKSIAYGFIEGLSPTNGELENDVPCAFVVCTKTLNAGESLEIVSAFGTCFTDTQFSEASQAISKPNIFTSKQTEMREILAGITSNIETKTSDSRFDLYIKQCYLDNVLRGGYPVGIEDNKDGKICYVYSRKHGDPERDYNWFVTEPTYYSTGNGNFRDVLQNRRCDIFFFDTGTYNIDYFTSLIQADGGNPLAVNGVKYKYQGRLDQLSSRAKQVLSCNYSYGELYRLEQEGEIKSASSILEQSEERIDAEFVEGYWTDHFVYLWDLVESYLAVYPDRADDMLYGNRCKYFVSPAKILPREEKCLLNGVGVRRYGAIDERATAQSAKQQTETFAHINGYIYKTSVASKLFNLAVIKMACLDPDGIGLDMESDKPGWNDALNGVSALFGSSVTDLLELKRLIIGLIGLLKEDAVLTVAKEQAEFATKLLAVLPLSGMDYFNSANTLKEEFRQRVYQSGFSGESLLNGSDALVFLREALNKINNNLSQFNGRLMPTYVIYDAVDYTPITVNGKPKISHYGLPCVQVNRFKRRELPLFLEAEAKYLALCPPDALERYNKVRASGLYDAELGLFKTSESLFKESQEIGRIRSFVEGWLERESCFLHMDYKYLYAMLKCGLYKEFYQEIRSNFVCFMNPERYGRSILENSSFIATSNHIDKSKHGQGFQARLTGANVEFLSMYQIMFNGGNPIRWINGQLVLKIEPKLKAEMFDQNNEVSFKLLNKTPVTIVNPSRVDTFDANVRFKITTIINGQRLQHASSVCGKMAEQIRNGEAEQIIVEVIAK